MLTTCARTGTPRARSARAIALVIATGVITACGSTDSSPTAPSPSTIPSVTGVWIGGVLVVAQDRATPARRESSCEHRWEIASQAGRSFSGTFRSQETGPHEPECAEQGTVSGEIAEDGESVSVRFSTLLAAPGTCTRVEGAGEFRGTVSASALDATGTDRLSCPGETIADADRTVTISMQRR